MYAGKQMNRRRLLDGVNRGFQTSNESLFPNVLQCTFREALVHQVDVLTIKYTVTNAYSDG